MADLNEAQWESNITCGKDDNAAAVCREVPGAYGIAEHCLHGDTIIA